MRKKILITKRKNGSFNQAILRFDKEMLSTLSITKDDLEIALFYENQTLVLEKRKLEKEIEIKDSSGNLIDLQKNMKLIVLTHNKEKEYFEIKLGLPSIIVNAMNLIEEPEIDIIFKDNKIIISKGGTMGKIFTIKVNKGGIGKTFLTTQIGHGLAIQGYKVLLLTSDSQNNILHYSFPKPELEKYDLSKGLRQCVLYGDKEDYYISLRKNLDFLPVESSVFTDTFEKKLPKFLEKKKQEYDFILIDSIPTMDIDKEFVACSDKIIVPTFSDYTTLDGTLRVIQEAGVEKVHSVITNLYKATSNQAKYYNDLKDTLAGTDVVFPEPIQDLSIIEELMEKGKTIWESRSKKLLKAQNSLLDIIDEMK